MTKEMENQEEDVIKDYSHIARFIIIIIAGVFAILFLGAFLSSIWPTGLPPSTIP